MGLHKYKYSGSTFYGCSWQMCSNPLFWLHLSCKWYNFFGQLCKLQMIQSLCFGQLCRTQCNLGWASTIQGHSYYSSSHFLEVLFRLLALVIIAMVKVMKICRNDKCKDQTTLNSVLLSLIRKSHHMEFSIMQKSFSCQTQLTKHLKQGSPVKLMVICVPKVPAAPLQHRECVPGIFNNIIIYTQIYWKLTFKIFRYTFSSTENVYLEFLLISQFTQQFIANQL